jgi:uncharacterized protein (TIGR02145 family)
MKTQLSILAIAVFFLLGISLNLVSQEIMNINKKDNTTISIPVSDIQSITFNGDAPVATGNTVTDIDGNVYPVVKIGHQVWMAENLRTTKYNDGTSIKLLPDYDLWETETGGAFCYYMNNADNKIPFGGLYNFAAVKTGKLCPKGWHVPVLEEWEALTRGLNDVPGAKLKETGTTNWIKNTTNVTNETGFTALPGGHRYASGKFSSFGSHGTYWTRTTKSEAEAFHVVIYDYTSSIPSSVSKVNDARSVRCVRD